MISVEQSGSFERTESFLKKIANKHLFNTLDKYAREGVAALAQATPVDSGLTKSSWGYVINIGRSSSSITWTNSNTAGGVPVAVMLQYGHGTGTGGYIQGRDYINPSMKPIFDKIADNVWKAVTNA